MLSAMCFKLCNFLNTAATLTCTLVKLSTQLLPSTGGACVGYQDAPRPLTLLVGVCVCDEDDMTTVLSQGEALHTVTCICSFENLSCLSFKMAVHPPCVSTRRCWCMLTRCDCTKVRVTCT